MNLRVLIVAEHASYKFGGEASLPLHYYEILRQREIPTWLVVHERTKEELERLFPGDTAHITYIKDTVWHLFLWRLSTRLPNRLSYFTTGFILRLITQLEQKKIIKKLVTEENITVIHQPMPVSPKEPSMVYGFGVPVIIGPMNGGMDYPLAFRHNQSKIVNLSLSVGRWSANLMNSLIPGKKQAAALLVANQRTGQALPQGVCSQVIELVENGVDLALWNTTEVIKEASSEVTRYVFVGRLVDWKAVDLLLLAFGQAAKESPMSLTIIGDGAERLSLESQAKELEIQAQEMNEAGKVYFAGWISQQDCAQELQKCDAMVLPSLLECGGAVVLEAMATRIPVIATAWGGPADYLDSSCGILVEPISREGFIENLSKAMISLAQSPEKRHQMGKAGREKVIKYFDWNVKVEQMIEIYNKVIANSSC